MAKDTEKLIRQLSLISYLMAERRPVTALEIRRDVEGYSDMTEDAFARRFYADRAELESLGIHLTVDKPADAFSEQENYSLAREAFHLPDIAFTDDELAALQIALALLDGQFAYAEPLRLALQQIAWGRPNPLGAPEQRTVALGTAAGAGGQELAARLAKIDTAVYRRKRIEFDYHTMERDEVERRRVDPYHLLYEGNEFYLVGFSHERGRVRVFRLSRIRGKVSYATKAEHDFQRPNDFDPRGYAGRKPWQYEYDDEPARVAEIEFDERVAWQVERQYSGAGAIERRDDGFLVFRTEYRRPRPLLSWVLGFGGHARVLGPPELLEAQRERVERLRELHEGDPRPIPAALEAAASPNGADGPERRLAREPAIRPERFARLVTLASILIGAGREGRRVPVSELCERLAMTAQELREDISVLNVVNFGGGSYVLYAEVLPSGEVEVDPEPYSDNFDRPARLLPIEAKALVAAIDFVGDRIPDVQEGALPSARAKIVAALGEDPVEEGLQVASPGQDDADIVRTVKRAIRESRTLRIRYYKPNEDEETEREVEPYALMNGREGWYVLAVDPAKDATPRHFRLDRIRSAAAGERTFERRPDIDPEAEVDGWLRTGALPSSTKARIWVSPEQARWAREQQRVAAELPDGSVVIELTYKGAEYLVKAVVREAGDWELLAPAELRAAVLAAADRLLEPSRALL